ncbi:MAG: trypsin-like peptidase domain-containing protein [Promicromonosporaceae bacterium]|nr:trypsin-like peptidase domain-containing protein [Promicromonosporaceae bacterium]
MSFEDRGNAALTPNANFDAPTSDVSAPHLRIPPLPAPTLAAPPPERVADMTPLAAEPSPFLVANLFATPYSPPEAPATTPSLSEAFAAPASTTPVAEPHPMNPHPPSYPPRSPGHSAPFGQQSFAAPIYPQPAQQSRAVSTRSSQRRQHVWLPVTVAALAAALLASAGTALIMHNIDRPVSAPTIIANIGDPGREDEPLVTTTVASYPNWVEVAAAVSPSVVSIQVSGINGSGEGSGMILDPQGHVLTNNHVVTGAFDDMVLVTLSDGRLYEALIVGLDPTTDLAVVRLHNPPSDLVPVSLGDSSEVQVGDPILTVGNPLGLANTATTGIVSAINRPVITEGDTGGAAVFTNAIQIDAAINPGNSGGPLFDATGRVIGINSSIMTMSNGLFGGSAGSIGLGFAIPVNLARNISAQLIENGEAQHAFLGVNIQDGQATADGVTRRGAEVSSVSAGLPADLAGVRVGDVVIAFDGQPINSSEALTATVRGRQVGETVNLVVVRDNAALELTVTLTIREVS